MPADDWLSAGESRIAEMRIRRNLSQRELADQMAAWAELQHELADRMAAWAELQRQLANAIGLWLAPAGGAAHLSSRILHELAAEPGQNR